MTARALKCEGSPIVIALMISLVFLLAMVGLAVDIGRTYVTKVEAQSFVDSVAVAAVTKLDGTSSGITQALHLRAYGTLSRLRAYR